MRAEVEAEVKVFREGKRDGKALKERALLETIYRPLRRALIVLEPPPPPPVKLDLNLTGKDIERIIGQPIDCLPAHQDLFDNTLQDSWYEGECRPKGGVEGHQVNALGIPFTVAPGCAFSVVQNGFLQMPVPFVFRP